MPYVASRAPSRLLLIDLAKLFLWREIFVFYFFWSLPTEADLTNAVLIGYWRDANGDVPISYLASNWQLIDVRLVLDDKALLNVTEINECLAMTFLFKKAIYLEGKGFLGRGVTLHGYIGYI